jgi:hypothetical protein
VNGIIPAGGAGRRLDPPPRDAAAHPVSLEIGHGRHRLAVLADATVR